MKKKIFIYGGYQKEAWDGNLLHTGNAAGTEKCIIQLAEGFKKLGHDVYVSTQPGISSVVNGVNYWSDQEREEKASTFEWDLVIGASYIHFYKIIENLKYKQSAFWFHNTSFFPWWQGETLSKMQIEELCKQAQHVICLSKSHKERVLKEHPIFKDKISIIGHGIDSNAIDKIKPITYKNGDTDDKFGKLFVYSSHPDRGLNKLLAMWPLISIKHWDAELFIFYPKYGEQAIDKYLPAIKKHSNITLMGSHSSEVLHGHMKSADYWIYPSSYNETFCCTALEAMACGAIPITSTNGSLREVLYSRGIIIHKSDGAYDVADYIKTLEKQPTLKAQLITNNYKYIKGLTWEKKAQEWLKL